MTLTVTVTPRVEEMIDELAEWWDENRSDARELRDIIESTCELLAESPYLGRPYPHPVIPGARKYRLKTTPYLLYYVPLAEQNELRVIGVWSGARKRAPQFDAE